MNSVTVAQKRKQGTDDIDDKVSMYLRDCVCLSVLRVRACVVCVSLCVHVHVPMCLHTFCLCACMCVVQNNLHT